MQCIHFSLYTLVVLPCAQKARILALRYPISSEPMSISTIARTIHCDHKTVWRVLQTYRETGNLHYQKPHSGRPHILSNGDVRQLALYVKRGKATNATDVQRQLASQASARTVRRNLCEKEEAIPQLFQCGAMWCSEKHGCRMFKIGLWNNGGLLSSQMSQSLISLVRMEGSGVIEACGRSSRIGM